jgi:peptidoglycan/LPS O-acetylase OafA/YrhL
MSRPLAYREDLDGLRAVAVLPVIFFHLGDAYAPGGFVGVDVFFVLSGFFITRLIARDLAENRFSLLGFYDRRIRRLFPALIAMLLVTTLLATIVLLPEDLQRFGGSLAAAALSLSNFAFWKVSGYFGPAAETMPLLHTWSLAVEEQFYIFFPLAMVLLWRCGPLLRSILLFAVALTSFALSVKGASAAPSAAFFLLPTRAWELALGGILALSLAPATSRRWLKNLATSAGLAAIAIPVFWYSGNATYPLGAIASACVGCALVIWAGQDRVGVEEGKGICLVGRALTLHPLVFVGKISYSLYLWHWPLMVLARQASIEPLGVWGKAALLASIFGAACLSWAFVEQPLRHGKVFWPARWQRFAYAGAAGAVIVAVGAGAYASGGFPQRIASDALEISRQTHNFSPLRARCHADGDGRKAFADTCVFGPVGAREVVLFGDSHGAELSFALSEDASANKFRFRQVTASACPPSLGFKPADRPNCPNHVEKMMAGIANLAPSTIIMTAAYFGWSDKTNGAAFWSGFERAVVAVRGAGHHVILLGGVPWHPNGGVPTALAKWIMRSNDPEAYAFPYDATLASEIDSRLRDIASKNNAAYIPLLSYVCGGVGSCRGYWDRNAIFWDDNHLSLGLARRIAHDLIFPQLAGGTTMPVMAFSTQVK